MRRLLVLLSLLLLITPLALVSAQPITVTVNRTLLHPGDKLIITVNASPNTPVSVEVQNPKGGVSYADQKTTDSQGVAVFEVTVWPPSNWPPGEYTIKAAVHGSTAQTTIKVEYLPPVGGVAHPVPYAQVVLAWIIDHVLIVVLLIALVAVIVVYNKFAKS